MMDSRGIIMRNWGKFSLVEGYALVYIKAMLLNILKCMFIMGGLCFFIINNFLAVDISLARDVTVISKIKEWQHPVKDILIKHKVIIYKVELHNEIYPTFYVRFPYDPRLAHNDKYFKPLYFEILKANGFWDYSFVDRSFHCKITITWDKKSRTLTESLHDID
jgi:hypothetical protein